MDGLVGADPRLSDDPRQAELAAPLEATGQAPTAAAKVPAGPLERAGIPSARWLASLLRLMRSKVVRFGFLAVVLALFGAALADQFGTLRQELQKLSAPIVLLVFLFSLCGLFCSLMVWREMLANLGSRLPVPHAWRIMFIGQLGKYVPGSIWPVLAQSELGADRGIPRSRSAMSVLLSYAVMTCSGAVVAAVTLPFATAGSVAQYFWVLFVTPVAIAVLSPPVLNRLLRLVLRLTHQSPMQQGVSVKGLARPMAWAMAGWACNGAMIYLLLRQLAGDRQGTLLVSIGAYSLSWVAGFLAVFAPAGAGIREAVMVAVLHTQTTGAIALTIALLIRAISVMSDALVSGAAGALVGRRLIRGLRSASRSAPGRDLTAESAPPPQRPDAPR